MNTSGWMDGRRFTPSGELMSLGMGKDVLPWIPIVPGKIPRAPVNMHTCVNTQKVGVPIEI